MKIRKIVSLISIITGILCIVGAGILLSYNLLEDKKSEENSREIMEILHSFSQLQEDEPMTEAEMLPPEELHPFLSQNTNMPIVVVEGNPYIGFLYFPSLDMRFPIMEDWDYEKLKTAPCRYHGSYESDDFVIAGHNYRSGFGRLRELQQGDVVKFTDMNGTVHEYIVDMTEILDATDIEAMIHSPWDLSLYTCTYDRVHRVTVRCKKCN